jgi:hypothetical protein
MAHDEVSRRQSTAVPLRLDVTAVMVTSEVFDDPLGMSSPTISTRFIVPAADESATVPIVQDDRDPAARALTVALPRIIRPCDDHDDDDDRASSTSDHGHSVVSHAASDARATELQRQYDHFRLAREVERLEGVALQLKEREKLLKRFYEDVTLPVTDDVGVTLGQIRALALELGSSQMDALIDKLESNIEDQMYVLLKHIKGSNEDLVAGTDFGKQMAKREEKRSRRKMAIERHAMDPENFVSAAEAEEILALAKKSAPRSTPQHGSSSLALAPHGSASSAHGMKRRMSTLHGGSPRGNLLANASFATAASHESGAMSGAFHNGELVGSVTYLIAEALAKAIRCERVRLYMSTDDGLAVQHATSFPVDPPSTTAPALPRSLFTSVFLRGIAIAGFQQTREATDVSSFRHLKGQSAKLAAQVNAKRQAKNTAAQDAAKGVPRCILAFPITIWSDGQRRVVGVLECENKEQGDDEVGLPEDPNPSAASSAHGKRFTPRDEAVAYTVTQLLGGLMERYPLRHFASDLGAAVSALSHPSDSAGHLPIMLEGDIQAATDVGNRSLRIVPTVNIFRGPMSTVHRHAVNKEDARRELLGSHGSGDDLRNVEESLDSLNAMWRKAYEDNVQMHKQCRNMTEKINDMRRVTERFEDALAAARDLPTIQDVHDYLRTVELSLKSGRVADVDRAIEGGHATADRARALLEAEEADELAAVAKELRLAEQSATIPLASMEGNSSLPRTLGEHLGLASASTARRPSATATPQPPPSRRSSNAQPAQSLATKPAAATPHRPTRVPTAPRRIPISEIHSDGPVDVRAYTVDPVSKRQQLKAISDMIDAEVAARAEAELVKLSSIPGFARSTASTVHRVERGPFDWAPAADPLKLDDAPSPVASTMTANRSATRSARGRGAPPILAISTAASSVTATLRTPFRLSAPQPSPRVLL